MRHVRGARRLAGALLAVTLASHARGEGVSAYLPLNLEPEIERQIERVLILAGEPILKRPFPVALVEDALPDACQVDSALCTKVRRYLERYHHDYAVTHASATASAARGADTVEPNQYGLTTKSDWELSGEGYVQPNDYLLASAGVIGYSGRSNPTGSVLSFGVHWAQVDIGYRDHWWSPMTDSSMIMSTEAPTMPSITLSNYEPLTRLGFQYEFFLARMAKQEDIYYDNRFGSGNPRLFGAEFSIEPFRGWSIGVNRLMQFGGADGLPSSASFLAHYFFEPSGKYQLEGNQQASYNSRFIFSGRTPFAVYAQYAGENTEDGGSYLLGNSAISAGIDFPRLARYFDLTYEVSEWQNTWYTHFVYLQGLTNDGLVLGNWGADQRNFGDGVGARSQMLRVGWTPSFGGYLEERIRLLVNQNYYGIQGRGYDPAIPAYPYRHYVDFTLRYSRPVQGVTVGGQLTVGQDVYGKSFSQLAAFVRYGGDQHTRDESSADDDSTDDAPAAVPRGTEWFVDAGVNANRVRADVEVGVPITVSPVGFGPHAGLGARRAVTENADLGVRLEIDEVQDHSLIGIRALDYRYRFSDSFAMSLFAGPVRYNLATPAFSLYGGVGAQWRDIVPKWDINLDFRYAQNVARDHVLASDVQGTRPDSFYKIESILLYVSRRF